MPTNRPRPVVIPVHVTLEVPHTAYAVIVQIGSERFVVAKFDDYHEADHLKHKLMMVKTRVEIEAAAA